MHYLRYSLVSLSIITVLTTSTVLGATTTVDKTVREAMRAERKEIKLSLKTDAKSRIKNRIGVFETASNAIFRGLENQDARMSIVIKRLQADGVDTTTAEALLETAREALAEAKKIVAESIASANTELSNSESSRTTLVGALEAGQDARKNAREAYRAVLTELKTLSTKNI